MRRTERQIRREKQQEQRERERGIFSALFL